MQFENCVVKNLFFRTDYPDGFSPEEYYTDFSFSKCSVENCTFFGTMERIQCSNAFFFHNYLRAVKVFEVGGGGATPSSLAFAMIGNTFFGTVVSFISLWCSTISSNTFYYNGFMELEDCQNCSVVGNVVYSPSYPDGKYTILLKGAGNKNNLIAYNNIMGKDVVDEGGTGNTITGNKFE